MAKIISMPQLSDTMEEGTVVKWNKKIGEKVYEGDVIAEIETDKAVQDFEIDINGVLLFIGVKEGEKTRVNDILAIIGKKGENIDHLINSKKQKNKEIEKKEKLRIESNNDSIENRKFISPLAKKTAKEFNLSLKNIKGSGDYGRIIKRDIDSYIENKNKKINNKNKYFDKKKPHSSMRKKIAKHLSLSKSSVPHYYLFEDINVDNLINLRKNLNDKLSLEEKISINDIIIKASAKSLEKNPKINVSWNEEYIYFHDSINIGFAVSLADGLIVPVIDNANKKSISQISKEIKEKINRSKLKKIQSKEIESSTFTVSNLGMYNIKSFTSIINLPNSSILSIGSIRKKPIIKNSKIEVGNIMKITLSCDHRLIDGVEGSNFISSIKEFLENPINILI